MSLCDPCNGLTIANLYPSNFHHDAKNMAALRASAEHCRLCNMLHWCLDRGNEVQDCPQLLFDAAVDEYTPYDDHKARNKCSVKLQIIPGNWNAVEPTVGFTHIGIWMVSKWMVADVTLAVEEGIVGTLYSYRSALTC
jgi:hypothetical protein